MDKRLEAARDAYYTAGMDLSWYRGWEAFYRGDHPILDNPYVYERNSLAWQNWGEGWIAAYGYEETKEEGWL